MASQEYPRDWDNRRKEVYRRDSFTCQNCGRQSGPGGDLELHAHHIVPKSKGGTHSKSNLVTVCKECHDAIHGNSYAPSRSSSSLRTSGSSEYFDRLSNLVRKTGENQLLVAKFALAFKGAINGDTQAAEKVDRLETELRTHCFDLKIQLASFDIHSAPSKVTDRYTEMLEIYIGLNEQVIEEIITLLDMSQGLSEVANQGPFCPECTQEILPDAKFCSACGNDLTDVWKCGQCGQRIESSDSYCPECGASVESLSEQGPNVAEIGNQAEKMTKQAELLSQKTMEIRAFSQKMTCETSVISSSSSVSSVDWTFCPECGYRNAVYEYSSRKAECMLCEAHWKKKGILSPNWKMTRGSQEGSKKEDDEWETLGKSKNENEQYRQYIEEMGAGADRRIQQKFS